MTEQEEWQIAYQIKEKTAGEVRTHNFYVVLLKLLGADSMGCKQLHSYICEDQCIQKEDETL